MTESRYALVYTSHRIWGRVFHLYLISKSEDEEFFRPVEKVNSGKQLGKDSEITELLRTIQQYDDKYLFKLFSRDKNLKEFTNAIDEERISKYIRPYIESKLFDIVCMATKYDIPIYISSKRPSNFFPNDLLHIQQSVCHPVFIFDYSTTGMNYKLSLQYNDKGIKLFNRDFEIISNRPACIRLGRNIYLIKGIDAKKVQPFIVKDLIKIPKESEQKYFESFVKNAIQHHKVINKGFDIIEKVAKPVPILSLEPQLDLSPALFLRFKYNDRLVEWNVKSKNWVVFHPVKEKPFFEKLIRNIEAEEKYAAMLVEKGLLKTKEACYLIENHDVSSDEELKYDLINWINEHVDFLRSNTFEVQIKNNRPEYQKEKISLQTSTSLDGEKIIIKSLIRFGSNEYSLPDLRKNILSENRVFDISKSVKAIIPKPWIQKYKRFFELGEVVNDELVLKKHHYRLLEEDREEWKELDRLQNPEHISNISLPHGLKAKLRPYQKVGFGWLLFLQKNHLGGCLADDMGLGKTVQVLSLLQWNKENNDSVPKEENSNVLFPVEVQAKTSLIVLPASLVHNWHREIQKFAPELKIFKQVGNKREKNIRNFKYYDIILSSYHTLRQDIDIIKEFPFHYVILDESQNVKNPESKLYHTVIQLKSAYRLVLTGTPIENSLNDLWSQLNFVNPGLLGNHNYFKKEFSQIIEQGNNKYKEESLQNIIQPFILRRTKEQVIKDLPPINEQKVYCEMTDDQMEFYDSQKAEIRERIIQKVDADGVERSTMMILQSLTLLRQIANHPKMIESGYASDSGKFNTILNDIENVISGKHKILLFSSFVKHLNLFARELDEKGIEYAMLTGSSTNREQIINDFQNKASIQVFLVSLKAGGVGLNLTAADYVFILDPWWNPAAEKQAVNRSHRIGQKKSVFVNKYITPNSIEEKILKLQERKSHLADTFINVNNPFKSIDLKEILALLE